ncbi:MAG: DNA packaging protein, partial [Lysobacter sp.]|nr:DNA packaging protein [Lysobacter sp.]
RLNNLYRIVDKDQNEVTFQLKDVQQELDEGLHHRNVVPKSRQHGITTWACIRALDTALFKKNSRCGLVFHTMEPAKKAFRGKVMYAYERLPAWLKAELPIVRRDMSGQVEFKNGSTIEVSTSHRGGTLDFLHISEYGPMCAMYPLRAQEVKSGALNTVKAGGIVTIESTAMGAFGDFYEVCKRAERHDRLVDSKTAVRTALDYKLFFFPWFRDPENTLDPDGVSIPPDLIEYFEKIEGEAKTKLSPSQRAWYAKKAEEQGDKMKREHPSTFDECFQGSVEGAYYANELARAEREGRICDLPFLPSLPVHTFWDIGRNDATAIWFMQEVGPWRHFIRYYENSGFGAEHYAGVLRKFRDDHGYQYGTHYLPHDAGVADWSISDNRTRREVLMDMRIGDVKVVERIKNLSDGIEMCRQMLAFCKFDKTLCGENPVGSGRGGLPSLRAYRRAFNEIAEIWDDKPIKSWANHGADAIRQAAQGFVATTATKPDSTPLWKKKLLAKHGTQRKNPMSV